MQGKITEVDTPTNQLGATPSRLISDPPPSSPIFTPDALPVATLPIYPGFRQAPNMLVCMPSDLVILTTSVKPKQLILFYYGIFLQLLSAVDVAAENAVVEKPKHQPFGFD